MAEYAALLKEYHLSKVLGDNYSAEWVSGAWRDCGISYERSELNKSALYLEALPFFVRGVVTLPNHPTLVSELSLLERRTSRMGKDTVDHGRNGHDDHANAVCGMLHSLGSSKYKYDTSMAWVDGGDDATNSAQLLRQLAYERMF